MTNEVKISGLIKYKSHGFDGDLYGIHATYSLGPHQVLNWYFNEYLLESSNPHFITEADGLNAVLKFVSITEDVYGLFSLKIEGTSIIDDFVFSGGKT